MRGYSKGMVQRVGLAQALIHDPDVYILDEPMSGLDPIGRALVKDIILDLKRRGNRVFFSTHITADVETVCDRVGIILKGELKCVEKVDKIMTEGVLGYNLRIRFQTDIVERYVAKEELHSVMQQIVADGAEITLIEPDPQESGAVFSGYCQRCRVVVSSKYQTSFRNRDMMSLIKYLEKSPYIVLFVLVAAIAFQTLGSDFLFIDDTITIVNNPQLKFSLANLAAIFTKPLGQIYRRCRLSDSIHLLSIRRSACSICSIMPSGG